MTSPSMTKKELETAKKRGLCWIVYAAYDHAGYSRGDVISRHKSYDAANRALSRNKSGFWGIADVYYVDPND